MNTLDAKIRTAIYWVSVMSAGSDSGPAPINRMDTSDLVMFFPGCEAELPAEDELRSLIEDVAEKLVQEGKVIRNGEGYMASPEDPNVIAFPDAAMQALYGYMRAITVVEKDEAVRVAKLRFLEALGVSEANSPLDATFLASQVEILLESAPM